MHSSALTLLMIQEKLSFWILSGKDYLCQKFTEWLSKWKKNIYVKYVRWNSSRKVYYLLSCSTLTKEKKKTRDKYQINKQRIEDAILGKKKTVVKGEEKEYNCLMQLQMHSRLKTLACSNPKKKRYSQVVLFNTALCLILIKRIVLLHIQQTPMSSQEEKDGIFWIIIVSFFCILLQLSLFKILNTLEETLTKPQIWKKEH